MIKNIKICKDCKLEKPVNDFYKRKDTKDKLGIYCKDCLYERCKIQDIKDKDKKREGAKKYRNKNKEKLNEKNKQRAKKYRLNSPEKVKESQKKFMSKPGEKEKRKLYSLYKNYGLTEDAYNNMREEQNYCCAICSKHETNFKKGLFVDHNHKTGKIRGLLCHSCNIAIGLLRDNPKLLMKTTNYLLYNETNEFGDYKKAWDLFLSASQQDYEN